MKKNIVCFIAFFMTVMFFAVGASAADTIVVIKDPRLDIYRKSKL